MSTAKANFPEPGPPYSLSFGGWGRSRDKTSRSKVTAERNTSGPEALALTIEAPNHVWCHVAARILFRTMVDGFVFREILALAVKAAFVGMQAALSFLTLACAARPSFRRDLG
jgi:hypothetical protein